MDDQNIVQSPPPPQPVTPHAPRSNMMRMLLIGLLLLLIGFSCGYFIASKNNTNIPSKTDSLSQITPSASPTNTPQPTATTPTSVPDETANWKTYTNADLSFKYPSEWTLSGAVITSKSPKIRLVAVSKEETLMNECMKESTTQIRNGLIIKMFTREATGAMCSGGDATSREIWVLPTRDVFSPGISYSYSADDAFYAENHFDQILSTFKFTNVK